MHECSSHAPYQKMVEIVQGAGLEIDEALIRKAFDIFGPCCLMARPPPVPKFSSTVRKAVGEQCGADFKFFKGAPIFHVIARPIKFDLSDETFDRSPESRRQVLRVWMMLVKTQNLFSDTEP